MLRKNCRRLIAGDRVVVPRDRIRPEKHVQHLIKAAFVADHAQPPDVTVELVLFVGNVFFRGCVGIFISVCWTFIDAGFVCRLEAIGRSDKLKVGRTIFLSEAW